MRNITYFNFPIPINSFASIQKVILHSKVEIENYFVISAKNIVVHVHLMNLLPSGHTLNWVGVEGGSIFGKYQGGCINFEFYCIFIRESQILLKIQEGLDQDCFNLPFILHKCLNYRPRLFPINNVEWTFLHYFWVYLALIWI